jgi:endoglucanase
VKTLVKNLVEAWGPAGYEGAVRTLLAGYLRDHVDEQRVDALGNLIALRKGSGSGGHKVMVAAHMDEIGVAITHVDTKGFMRFGAVGGVSPLTLVGSRVRFANGTVGVIGWEKWLRETTLPAWHELFIDVGARDAGSAPVGIGDLAAFDRPFVDLGQRLVSKAMDDRIACAVAVQAAMNMTDSVNDVYFCFTVQEEVGLRGATVSAYGIAPEVGLAVDVTPVGDTPEAIPMSVSLGLGPAIKVKDSGMLAHPGVKDWMIRTAEEQQLPYQLEVLQAGTTDARAIQTAGAGVPAGCLSLPCRYVHTPSEMVDLGDVQQAVTLLVALLSQPIAI